VAERDGIELGKILAAAGAAEEDREVVPNQLAAKVGEEGGRLVKHARYCRPMLAESHLTRAAVQGDGVSHCGVTREWVDRGPSAAQFNKEEEGRNGRGETFCR
jgi:hypothetical protein